VVVAREVDVEEFVAARRGLWLALDDGNSREPTIAEGSYNLWRQA
jgi:hypothetical protein